MCTHLERTRNDSVFWNWDKLVLNFLWSELNVHRLSWKKAQRAGEARSDIAAFQDSLQPRPLGGLHHCISLWCNIWSVCAAWHIYPSWYPDNISVGTFQFDAEGRFCPFSETVESVTECLCGQELAIRKQTDAAFSWLICLGDNTEQYLRLWVTITHENVLCFDCNVGRSKAVSWKR